MKLPFFISDRAVKKMFEQQMTLCKVYMQTYESKLKTVQGAFETLRKQNEQLIKSVDDLNIQLKKDDKL